MILLNFGLLACSLTRTILPPTPVGKGFNTATPFPTHTMQPSQVPSQTPTTLVPATIGTGLPTSLPPISAENVDRLALLARYGEGMGMDVAYSADGSLLVVATTRGFVLYDGQTLEKQKTIDTKVSQRTVTISPDKKWLAGGAEDGSIRLWKLPDGILQMVLLGHTQPVFSLDFSPDGQWLASGSWDNSVRIWYVPEGNLVRTYPDPLAAVRAVHFSPDGDKLFAWTAKQPLQVWDFINNKSSEDIYIGVDNRGRTGSSAAFAVDGSLFAIDQDTRVRLMNTEDGTTRAQLLDVREPVLNVALSSDGELAATLQAGSIKVWTTQPAALLHTFELDDISGGKRLLCFDPQGERLLALGDSLWVYDLRKEDAGPQMIVGSYASTLRVDAAFTGDGSRIRRLFHDSRTDLVHLKTGEVLPGLNGLDDAADLMALSVDGSVLAVSHKDGDMNLYDTLDGSLISQLEGNRRALTSLAVSNDGQRIAFGTFNLTVQVWDAALENMLAELEQDDIARDLRFSPDGRSLAVKQGAAYRVYDVGAAEKVAYINGHDIVFSEEGDKAAVLGVEMSDPVVRVVELDSGEVLFEEKNMGSDLDFSPAGDLLVVNGNELTIRDVLSGEVLLGLPNPAPQGEVTFSPDGSLILVSGSDGVLYLYGVE